MKRSAFFIAVLAIPVQAWAYGEGGTLPSQDSFQNFRGTTQAAGVSQTIGASLNILRKGFCLFNPNNDSLWVNFGTAATMDEVSWEVPPGERCFNIDFTGQVFLIGPLVNMRFKGWSW